MLIILGQRGNEQRIADDGDFACFSNIPVKILRDALLSRGIPAKVSNSAGLYVCNSTYYNTLDKMCKPKLPTKAVFVHLPKISNDFPIELLKEAVKTIIEIIIDI